MLVRIWRRGKPCAVPVECKLAQPIRKTLWRFLKKLNTELPYDLAISLLSIYPKKMKTLTWKDICTPMFTEALFIIAKKWKQSEYLLTNEWIRKSGIYTRGILFSNNKEWNISPGNIMDGLWEPYAKWNKSEKDKYCMISLINGI